MISEVVNAVALTFVGTEYLLAQQGLGRGGGGGLLWGRRPLRRQPRVVGSLGGAVALVNLVERGSGLGNAATAVLHRFAHVPKILLAAVLYVIALFYDCRRIDSALGAAPFARHVGSAFLYVLPVYPCLAVLISVAFGVLVSVLEALHVNPQILNAPIYYGVLYGPFSFVYWRVKEATASTLPTTTSNTLTSSGLSVQGGRILGE